VQLTFSITHFKHLLTALVLIGCITASPAASAQNYSPGGDPNNCTSGQARINNTCMDVGTSTTNFYDPNSAATNSACDGEGQARINNECVQVRAATSVTPMFVPERIKIGAGASAYYLDPTTENSSWADCKSGIGTQDSTCVVPYKYGVAAGLATITAGFTKANPVVGGTGTSPKWNSTNATSVSVACTGAATWGPGPIPVQGNPSGVTFNSPVPGTVTCVYTALNSDNEPTTTTATATFSNPLPPTIAANFTDPNPIVGGAGTSLRWNSTNAASVYIQCPGYPYGPGYIPLQGNPSGVTFNNPAGTITCNFTATNVVGATATTTASVTFTNPPLASLNAYFDPPAITAGESSTLHWGSGGAISVGMVCGGVGFAGAWQQPINQTGYFPFYYSAAGVENCTFGAVNPIGEVTQVDMQLNVFPAGTPAAALNSPAPSISDPGVEACTYFMDTWACTRAAAADANPSPESPAPADAAAADAAAD
jgi:hypothetical protein